jgi:putative ABC transport system substrate-binding protein
VEGVSRLFPNGKKPLDFKSCGPDARKLASSFAGSNFCVARWQESPVTEESRNKRRGPPISFREIPAATSRSMATFLPSLPRRKVLGSQGRKGVSSGALMQRREFMTLLGGTAAAWPLAAHAQQPAGRAYKIGYQSIGSREQTLGFIKAFEESLRSLGYRVGDNVIIEYRFADGEMDRLPALSADLVRLGVDVIIATGVNLNAVAAMKATTIIPIVITSVPDPVRSGLIDSLARPGGNVTGLAVDAGGEILGKRFELLKEALPNLLRLGIMFNPDVALNRSRQALITETARTLGLTTIPVEARGADELEQAFATMVRAGAQAFVLQGDSVLFNYRGQIAEMALSNGLPACGIQREVADAGFLLTYGADIRDLYRRAAGFVDKIFKGAKPADLPVEQPTKFELIINLKTAKALGIIVPPTLLARADEVIE